MANNKSSPTKSKDRKSQRLLGREIIWWLNLLFLPICLSALTYLIGITLISGLAAGLAISALLYIAKFTRQPRDQEKGLRFSIRTAIRVNSAVLLVTVLLSSYFLWGGLLRQEPPDIAGHTVILFFLLGLGCVSVLLRFRYSEIVQTIPIEQRLYNLLAGPSLYLSFCLAVVLTSLTMILFYLLDGGALIFLKQKFLQRGLIPPLCLTLFYWELVLLSGKYYLALRHLRVVAGSSTLPMLWDEYSASVKKSKNNQRMPADFLEMVWQVNENFYFVPRYINWAIPILGFIGTVLGISLAAGEIGNIVGSASANIGEGINLAMKPLSIAFDTTLIALSLSVFLVFLYTALQKWEEKKFLFVENQLVQK